MSNTNTDCARPRRGHATAWQRGLLGIALPPLAAMAVESADQGLFQQISAQDTAMFDSFNRCQDPAQLQRHASFFAADVEFYHDTGGVTWDREAMLANTAKYACGKFRRELVEGSLKVYPIKDFGAIAQGTHRFCQNGAQRCEGMADFSMVWRLRDGHWEATRVLSYGHRPAEQAQ